MDATTEARLTDALFATRSDPKEDEFRTGLTKLIAINRCREERDEILNREDVTRALCVCNEMVCVCPGVKAWLVVLGLEDWECEKRLIEAEA